MVAIHFMKIKDYTSAIKFIVVSKCNQEAFEMAKAHNQMELYADIIGSDATTEDYLNIADYFEEAGNHFLAGKFFLKAQHYDKVWILTYNNMLSLCAFHMLCLYNVKTFMR